MTDEGKWHKKLFPAFFSSNTAIMAITRMKDGVLVDVNDAWLEATGLNRDDAIGRTTAELNIWADSTDREYLFRELKEKGRVRDYVLQLRHSSGSASLVLMSMDRVEIDGEQYLLGIAQDITDRRRIEIELQERKNELDVILNSVPAMIWLKDADGRYIMVNEGYCRSVGMTREAMTGLTDYDLYPKDIADLYTQYDNEVIKSRKPIFDIDDVFIGPAGARGFCKTNKLPYFNATGELVGTIGFALDITSLKETQNELLKARDELEARVQERTQKLEALNQAFMEELKERNLLEAVWKKTEFITNSAQELMTLINRHYIYESVNDAYCRAHGRERDDIVGKTAAEIWGESRFTTFIKPKIDRCLQGEVVADEDWIDFSFAGRRYFTITYYPYSQSWDTITHVSVISHDITERKLALEALRESELKYRNLFDDATDGIMMMDLDGSNIVMNKSFARIHGYTSPQEMARLKLSDLDTPETAELAPERLRRLAEGESMIFEVEHYHRNGHTIWLSVSCNVIRIEGHRFYLGFHQDITERKRAEATLKKQEQDLKQRALELEEANTALRVFFRQHSEDQKRVEEKLQLNINELVMPYIEKLKQQNMGKQYLTYLELLELNLQNILSPFMKNLSAAYQNLTPQEIQIAEMIRQGKSSQEMAAVLNLSVRTVNTHRNNMRKKLNLKNRSMNLRSYLLSLS